MTTLPPATVSRIKASLARGMTLHRGVKEAGRAPADPGDFGQGTYYSTSQARARCYGKLTSSTVKLSNPLILTDEEAYTQIADRFGTISGVPGQPCSRIRQPDARPACSATATATLRAEGYDGVVALNLGVNLGNGELEVVVFP